MENMENERPKELKTEADSIIQSWEKKAEFCSCRIRSTNACKLVDRFCNMEVCPFNYWLN